jgi:hypothetical protein
MRDSLRALTISGALTIAVALAPVMAQTEAAAQGSGTSATPAAQSESNAQPPASQSDAASQAPASPDAAAPKDGAGSPAPDTPAAAKDPNAPQFDRGSESTSSPDTPALAIAPADLKKALSMLRRTSRDYAPCTSTRFCTAYFDSFGVGFTFADGTLAPFSHEQRLQISGHDCVVNARSALGRGDRSMAVQWMMAAQADILNRNWIGDHPDAMVEALRTFRGWG